MIFNVNEVIWMSSLSELGKIYFHSLGSLSSRLKRDVDKMGRTVALNANAAVRSTVKACFMIGVMLHLSWELTVLTCIEILVMAMVQNKYIPLSKVGGALAITAR